MKTLRTKALLFSLTMLTMPAWAGNVLFVNNNGSDLTVPAALAADGHTVTSSNLDPTNPAANTFFQSANLGSYCAVVWSVAYARNAPDLSGATSTLSTWVSNGGRLLITSPDGIIPTSGVNPTGQMDLIGLIGGSGARDQGYTFSAIPNVLNSLTTGVVDIRNQQPTPIGDTDSLCGPLSAGTVGLVTTSDANCPGPGYVWTLRSLGLGQVGFITSGYFNGVSTPDPDWSNTAIPGDGVYNAGLRNFVNTACTASAAVAPTPIPAISGPMMALLTLLLFMIGAGYVRRKKR